MIGRPRQWAWSGPGTGYEGRRVDFFEEEQERLYKALCFVTPGTATTPRS